MTELVPTTKPQESLAIVVVAYNRPRSLTRILKTIEKAIYPKDTNIPLLISIDNSGCNEVLQVAQSFIWTHGTKKIISHPERLGLRKHVLFCGDLTEQYDAVIALEDDLLVAPGFYSYAAQAVSFYKNDTDIGGISLYAYDFNEYAELKFIPISDDSDNYFIQTASSWGQIWTRCQWVRFRQWYDAAPHSQNGHLPRKLLEWPETSWKKYFIRYMVSCDKYFVYPQVSLSTNSGDAGTNHGGSSNFQVPLRLGDKQYKFSHLKDSTSIYDAHYELKPACLSALNESLTDVDFECDFYGTKSLEDVKSSYLLSIKQCKKPMASYALSLVPAELNIAYELLGDDFHLAKTKTFTSVTANKRVAQLKHLHKNIGWKRYGLSIQQTILNYFRGRLSILGKSNQ